MYQKSLLIALLVALGASSISAGCNNPSVSVTSFTTEDATIVNTIAFIAEFSLKCANDGNENIPLMAEIDGKITPVARIVGNKYQVSWNEEIKSARSGDHLVRLFDEDSFAAVRKAQRTGESFENVKALTTLTVRHPGASNGPWINSEYLAAGLSLAVAYVAFSTKSKLLA